jgi:hypothetical protein
MTTSFNVKLPNLRFRENKIYFAFNNPIKIKNEIKRELILSDNLELSCKLNIMNCDFLCTICEEELSDCLKMNVKYSSKVYFGVLDLQKISNQIESQIIGIDLLNEEKYEEDDTNSFKHDIILQKYHDKLLKEYEEELLTEDNHETLENKKDNYEEYDEYDSDF